METNQIGAAGGPIAPGAGGESHLLALCGKAAGGDWISECLQLSEHSRLGDSRVQRAGVIRQGRLIQEAREAQKRLERMQQQARRRSGFWKFFGAVTGGVLGVIGAIASLYCPLLIYGSISLVGAACAATGKIASAENDRSAADATGQALLSGQQRQEATEVREEILAAMESSVAIERQMAERLLGLVEGEYAVRDAALSGMTR